MKSKKWLMTVVILGPVLLASLLAVLEYMPKLSVFAPESLGSVRLNVETYSAGENQPTHPSVYDFGESWNGYQYWMAYSPYPNAYGEEENPCIACSNDLLFWEYPVGLANPIANNEETGCDELKDPHIVYREDIDRLEVWYLGRLSENLGGDGETLLLFRKCSYDGVVWSDYEVMAETQYLSPTVIWKDGKYHLWEIGYSLYGTTGTLIYRTSIDGREWSEPILCSVDGEQTNVDMWHGAVSIVQDLYQLVYIDNDKQVVWHSSSLNGIHFDKPTVIVENGGFWKNLYRPMLVRNENEYWCVYGVVNWDNKWYLSASAGDSVNSLYGLRPDDVMYMNVLEDEVSNAHSLTYLCREFYYLIERYICIELASLVVVEGLVLRLVRRKVRCGNHILSLLIGNYALIYGYVFVRFSPMSLGHVSAAIISAYMMSIAITCSVWIMVYGGDFRERLC